MFVLSIIETILLPLYVAYLVREYSQKEVPLYVQLLTLISWVLSFGIVFVIPHDIYFTLKYESTDHEGFDTISTIWRVIYWVNFVFTWIVLPLFQEYEDAGEFTFKGKMLRSIKNNLIVYGLFAAFGIVFIVYLTAYNRLEWTAVLGILVALANCFGVLLVVLLLGHGLVAIPRDYWRKSQYEQQLNNLYLEVSLIDSTIADLHYQLEEQATLLILVKKSYENHPLYFQYIELILSQIPYEFVEQGDHLARLDSGDNLKTLGCVTMAKLVDLNRKIKKLIAEYKRSQTKWDELCSESFLLEDLQDNKFSVHYKIRSNLRQQRTGTLGHFVDVLTWLWYTKIKRLYLISLFAIFTSLSTIIILGEISIFTQFDMNLLGKMINKSQGFVQVQLTVMIPLMYISFCAFYGLFHINFAGMYGFYKGQHTDAPSLLFGSINFSRVSFPLTFNFLQMMKITGSPFTKVIGDMDVVPVFGMSFAYCLPILLILASMFNFFEIYDKILQVIGLPQFQFSLDSSIIKQEEGKKLLCKARTVREREILNVNSQSIFKDVEMQSKQINKSEYKYFAFQNYEEILKI